jgi:hypothetical protein
MSNFRTKLATNKAKIKWKANKYSINIWQSEQAPDDKITPDLEEHQIRYYLCKNKEPIKDFQDHPRHSYKFYRHIADPLSVL